MSNFQQAMQWMEEGKKVRIKSWESEKYYWFVDTQYSFDNLWCIKQSNGTDACLIRNFIEATDWEIYEEKESDGDLLKRLGTDGGLWAKEFIKKFGNKRDEIDEGLMITWFCNAIEAGKSAK